MTHGSSPQGRKPNVPQLPAWKRPGRRSHARRTAADRSHGLSAFRALRGRAARRAVACERRRIARELHDGLAQELAFIASLAQLLEPCADEDTLSHLRSASERALHECRSMLTVLTADDEAPIELLVGRTAELFRSRFGTEVEVALEGEGPSDPERRRALVRILHEALTNAVRHGSADRVLVRLIRTERRTSLSVRDDGQGFDVHHAQAAGRGLGLTSMRERAELLGGRLNILSAPGCGTLVEVVLP